MSNSLYEEVDKMCQRVDSYAEKDISVKNEVKTTLYITKIKKLIDMMENAENNAYTSIINTEEKPESNNKLEDDQYNPYSENFCYKERLDQLDGDINKLIEQLKSEDQTGHRYAYIINEIEKRMNKNSNIKVVELSKKNKFSLWEKIKRIFNFFG